MTLMERLTRQRENQYPPSYATTSNTKKASDKEKLNVYKPPRIKASSGSYPTPKGRNVCVVIELETIPEITNLEIAQFSKFPSLKAAKSAAEDTDYLIPPSDASSVESRNERVKGSTIHSSRSSGISSIKPENIDASEDGDDSLRDLSWILLIPGLFPEDNEGTENTLRLDESTSTTPHTSVEKSSASPPINQGLPSREKPPATAPPAVFFEHDAKTTNYPTVSKPDLLTTSRIRLPPENSGQPSPSIKPQASLSKDIERSTTELQQQRLAVASERNFHESFSRPLRPSYTPPVPPKSEKRQPVPVASPPPKPPPPPWKSRDPDKRPSIQIDSPLPRPQRYPEIPSDSEQSQVSSRCSQRPITQRVLHGCKKFIDDALELSRCCSLRKDSAHSLTPSQIRVDRTQAGPKLTKAATRTSSMSLPQPNLSFSSSYRRSFEKGDVSTPSSRNSETGTKSSAPSRTSKASSFLSKAAPSKLKTKLSQILSRKNNVREAIEEKCQLPELEFHSTTLLPFQCTMCFTQLNNKSDWIQHEQRHNGDAKENSEWYWRCGICGNILNSWDDRQNHIADEHFEIGQTLSNWNSSTSPYPWDKESSQPIPDFPPWDMSILRSMQPTLFDDIYRKTEPRNACGVCDLAFLASSDLDQHMKQNHVSWSCPTTARKGKAANFFEMCRDGCEDQFHSCRCCGMSFCDDSADWKQRKQHFEEDHQFLKCDHDQFFEHAQFCHHLAGSHHVEIEFLGMTDLCRQKEYASS